jgi:hypothetical protein
VSSGAVFWSLTHGTPCGPWATRPITGISLPAFYSDLAVTRSGTILCFYGSGPHSFAGQHLTLARFGLDWVEGRE